LESIFNYKRAIEKKWRDADENGEDRMSKKNVAAGRKSVPAVRKREQVPDFSSHEQTARDLAAMTDFKEIKAIRDKAEGFKVYATAAKDPKWVDKAIRIYYSAKDNMGRVIKEMRGRKELVDAKGASGKATAKAKNSLSPEDRLKTWADLESLTARNMVRMSQVL
jgi:hypothetical protein